MKYGVLSGLIIVSFSFGSLSFGAENALAWQENSDTQQKLLACQKLEKMEDQLACFNRIASDMSNNKSPQKPAPKKAKPQAPVKPESLPPSTNESERNFGLSSDEIARRDGTTNEPETIRTSVVEWRRMFNRHFEVTLANGQVWQETSGSFVRLPSKENLSVTITKTWGGGYRMKFDGIKRLAKVKRVK